MLGVRFERSEGVGLPPLQCSFVRNTALCSACQNYCHPEACAQDAPFCVSGARVCSCRHGMSCDVQAFLTSSGSEASQPAPERRRGKGRADEGSEDDDDFASATEGEEESFAKHGRQTPPTRQLPGRSSRPVSYKDNSNSSGTDDDEDDADVAGAHIHPSSSWHASYAVKHYEPLLPKCRSAFVQPHCTARPPAESPGRAGRAPSTLLAQKRR